MVDMPRLLDGSIGVGETQRDQTLGPTEVGGGFPQHRLREKAMRPPSYPCLHAACLIQALTPFPPAEAEPQQLLKAFWNNVAKKRPCKNGRSKYVAACISMADEDFYSRLEGRMHF